MTLAEVQSLVAAGESKKVELKKSTAQLKGASEALCAFLNDDGGMVVLGVTDDGKMIGQQVSDQTRREIAAMLDRFEPPAPIDVETLSLPGRSTQLVVMQARPQGEARPFTFNGRPYQRVQTTTSVMPQERYETMLLERAHARRRWENQPAVGVRLEDLDREEIFARGRPRSSSGASRPARAWTSATSSTGSASASTGDHAGRSDALRHEVPARLPASAAQARPLSRTKITGDILDNRQEYLHAFAMVREAIAWLDRTLPLSARFPEGRIIREDRLPVPRGGAARDRHQRRHPSRREQPELVCRDRRLRRPHRDPQHRRFHAASRAELLTQEHRSIPRNPLIAGASTARAPSRSGAVAPTGSSRRAASTASQTRRSRRPRAPSR